MVFSACQSVLYAGVSLRSGIEASPDDGEALEQTLNFHCTNNFPDWNNDETLPIDARAVEHPKASSKVAAYKTQLCMVEWVV